MVTLGWGPREQGGVCGADGGRDAGAGAGALLRRFGSPRTRPRPPLPQRARALARPAPREAPGEPLTGCLRVLPHDALLSLLAAGSVPILVLPPSVSLSPAQMAEPSLNGAHWPRSSRH
eukprot:2210114-Rhodomonas_salina.2